jgi:MerR family redox-sensitive transcriptional activator SoxR
MPLFNISEVARRIGVRPSAIRYYEQIGVLPPAQRVNKQRRYDQAVLYRLAVIQRARQVGFSLDETRQLFYGFRRSASPSQRWKHLSRRKLDELSRMAKTIRMMQSLLRRSDRCRCASLDECGKWLLSEQCGDDLGPLRTALRRKEKTSPRREYRV